MTVETTVELVQPGFRDFVGRGPVGEVGPWAARLADRADAELVYKPRPDPQRPGWVIVRVRLRGASRVPARRETALDPLWPRLTLRQPQTVARRDWSPLVKPAVLVGGAIAGVGLLLWVVAQAVRGVVAAAAPHLWWLIPAGVLAAVAWARWKLRDRGTNNSGSGSCPGLTHHCPKCPDH